MPKGGKSHDIIPQDEIWKVGGDKGGGSFKMNFQIVNTLPMQSTTCASSLALKPKMHMLKDHTMEWARARNVGFGLFGEQGAESIHSRFNSLGCS